MELGCDLSPSPTNFYIVDVVGLALKRARSPPKLAQTHEVQAYSAQGSALALLRIDEADHDGEQWKSGSKGYGGGSSSRAPHSTMLGDPLEA